MEDETPDSVLSCGECGKLLEESDRVPCPQCGSTRRCFHEAIEERVKIRESFKLDVRRQGFPSRRQPRVSEFSGSEKRKADGEWVDKVRIIDKEQNVYIERVTLEATGEVIRDVREPLSEHIGHGSAKFSGVLKNRTMSELISDKTMNCMEPLAAQVVVLRAAWPGAVMADNAEAGFARIREMTGCGLDDAALARAVAACIQETFIREPVRLPEGALHCHWTLELTAAGVDALRKFRQCTME